MGQVQFSPLTQALFSSNLGQDLLNCLLHIGFCPPLQINQTNIPQTETVKYLGIHFDRRLTWKDHVQTKRKQIEHKTREIKWLLGRLSPLSLENKIIIYKIVLKLVWTYGTELWGCASNSNIEIIQRYQSKILRILTNAPWYLIFVVPCIMLNSEIIPTRCNNCVYSSQWLYCTCFG